MAYGEPRNMLQEKEGKRKKGRKRRDQIEYATRGRKEERGCVVKNSDLNRRKKRMCYKE